MRSLSVPIWTISTGRNFGYGSAAPQSAGQVVLDLKHMNRILDVDPVLCTALVEPGVTYQQLKDYLEENDIPLWLSCPAPSAIAGPLGNTVDRGVGYTPYGDHFMMQCGMEVALPNGELMRTGMGALPGNNTWQLFKYGFGPYVDGMFTQGNFGIVTKMGFWLMPEPEAFLKGVVHLPRFKDLTDRQILDRAFKLGDAQELVARQSGFESWQAPKSGMQAMPAMTSKPPARPEPSSIQAQLFVADIRAACAYYGTLGFETVFVYGEPPFYGQVKRGVARLNLRMVCEPLFVGDVREREGGRIIDPVPHHRDRPALRPERRDPEAQPLIFLHPPSPVRPDPGWTGTFPAPLGP